MGSKKLKKGYLSIGKVVEILKKDYPDLSISKIRYLEDEGLVEPKRTPGGYRRFVQTDVERLGLILKLQKERYLPLKVIKGELRKVSTGRVKEIELVGKKDAKTKAEDTLIDKGKRMSIEEASDASGMTTKEIKELESYGLVKPESSDKGKVYTPRNIKIMHLVKNLGKHGIHARHLRMYQSFAERESSLLSQIVAPVMKQKNETAKNTAVHTLGDLTNTSAELRQALLDNSLKDNLEY